MTTSSAPIAKKAAESTFDPVASARALLRSARRASLSTLDRDSGRPYVSLIGIATAEDGAPLLLVSDLARHTVNLGADPRASVLLADVGAGDPLAHPRVTLFGTCVAVDKAAKKTRWLARQPESEMYYEFGDFRMLRLEPEGGHLVAGFGRIVDLAWDDVRTETAGADALFEAEAGIVEHMNDDHADATRLYATALLGAPDGAWRFEGVDPLGCEIGLDGRSLYLPFPEAARTAGDVRKMLVALVAEARGAAS
ncbi:HugZ family protein [Hansschlegelia sp. KR7-227]|jgi:putative heme iron utilization protein|uniref:HugZ family pyridoxamine 5'-phosphate oxidase n=1 Tax=Hansschlegelia sp. KR7-227 TaxID=3400914 RepID=UPI003C07477D